MDRANLNVSRFLTFAAVVAAGFLCGCQPDDTTTYDPRIDGITPPQVATAEPGILDDQKNRPHVTAAVPVVAKPAAPAPAATTAPAADTPVPPAAPDRTSPPPPPAPETAPAGPPPAAG